MKGQDVEGLAHQSKNPQPEEIFFNTSSVKQPYGQTVAEDRKRQSAYPPEDSHFWEECPADVINEHGDDGNAFEKISIKISFQPFSLRGDDWRSSKDMADAGGKGLFGNVRSISKVIHGDCLLVILDLA